MVTKRATPAMKTLRPKARAVNSSIDAEIRRQLVAAEAYFLAERRGFAGGHELEDWVAAEAAVDARLHTQAA